MVREPLLGAVTSRVLLNSVLRPVLVSCCSAPCRRHAGARAVGVTGAADMTHDSLELGVVQGTPGGGVSGGWGGGAAAGVSNVRLRRCDIGRHKLLVSAPVDGVVASATAVSGCGAPTRQDGTDRSDARARTAV